MYIYSYNSPTIITDKDALKTMFWRYTFENEDTKCNYFAIAIGGSSYNYLILSDDMVLYKIGAVMTSGIKCGEITVNLALGILVCDDTDDGNLKDRIDSNPINYTDPDWDCAKEYVSNKGVFF